MGIKLQDVLKLGGFADCRVMTGHCSLDREIETITVLEVPEVAKWVKGNELILTSLYAVNDDVEAQITLIERLHTAGATALAIKPSNFIKEISQDIIDYGNRIDFPIIEIPEHIKYLDIMSPVMHALFDKKVVLQEDLERATKILDELTLEEQGIHVFAKNLELLVKSEITIESELSSVASYTHQKTLEELKADKKMELSIVQRPLQMNREQEGQETPCVIVPIIVEGEYLGNITSWGKYNQHLATDLAILEKAAKLLSFEFLKKKVKLDIEQQYESDFIRELLFSHNIREKSVVEWGGNYRITRHCHYVSFLFSVQDCRTQNKHYQILKNYKLTNLLKRVRKNVLVGTIRNGICLIIEVGEEEAVAPLAKEYYQKIAGQIGRKYRLFLGVGRVAMGLKGIQQSFLQAEKALYFSERTSGNHISYYDALGIYRLIYSVDSEKELESFYNETIGNLLKTDKSNELLQTMVTYFECNEVLKDSADALFIHVNTLKYRLNKIEELTGFSLKKSEDKLNLFVGLKIYDLLQQETVQF
ncbi:PucR family transcriptional regulator ligand-binding domain-containing protein [Sporosarcina sp. 179-K 8C2 HS]|uniref:PucR family transcriptional regulator n=1 Tax=Sporosarcina sp. 179-K 8C2 HS TaxID=3142387 RepID=UPI0039A06CDA